MKQGQCKVCGKKFDRPHGFRTMSEELHEHTCNLERIQNIYDNDLDELDAYDITIILDDLHYISKVMSFGARPESKYLENMKWAEKLKKLFKEIKNDK